MRFTLTVSRVLLIIALLCRPSSALPQARLKTQAEKTSQGHLDVRVNAFVDLYFFVFKLASESGKMPDIEGFAEGVDAARGLFGVQTLARLDVDVSQFASAADILPAFSRVSETTRLIANGKVQPVQTREKAIQLAKALMLIEKPFREKIWPQHKTAIEQAAVRVTTKLIPKERECFAYITKNLGMEDTDYTLPVYLVAESPAPGGFTNWQGDRHGVCFVGIDNNKGSQLFETVLHESIHALDLETKGKENVLEDIRNRLKKAGVAERDPDMRNVAHTIMFIQAAETVRRFVDPTHKHYGDVAGYYAKVPVVAKIELPIWIAYLDGKISREAAISQIIEGILKTRKRTSSSVKTITPARRIAL